MKTLPYIIAAVMLLAISCTRTVYTPVESVRTEWRDREVERIVADTVTDTRIVFIKGDTVIDLRERERTHRIEIHDTIKVFITDTIRIPYPVEKQLSKWQQLKLDIGGIALGIAVAAIIAAIGYVIYRIRRRR